MIDGFRFPRFDREDFMDVQGAMHSGCYDRRSQSVNAFCARCRAFARDAGGEKGQTFGRPDKYLQRVDADF